MRIKTAQQVIPLVLGTIIVLFELISAEYLKRSFHFEFLVLAASFFGISVTQWGDKRNGSGTKREDQRPDRAEEHS